MSNSPKKFLEAGKITGIHGVRGDLKVLSWCDSPHTLCDFDTLYLDPASPVTVTRAQVHKNIVLMHLQGVDSPESAEALRGQILYLNRDDVQLPENRVFIQDILSFQVFDRRLGRVIGCVRNVLTTNPAQDLYEVTSENGKPIYIPAAKPFLREIDMSAGVIYIESIEGLVD